VIGAAVLVTGLLLILAGLQIIGAESFMGLVGSFINEINQLSIFVLLETSINY
jgi:hypothetical protein